ncbi:MAG: DUF1570 domain-containing protein, partial [Planctomycetota bacterium]
YGRHMDAVYDQFARRFSRYSSRLAGATENGRGGLMPLYLFRTQDEYLGFLASHGIAAEGSGGLFFITHAVQGLATWTDGHPRAQTFRTLQHEGFHQFAWHHLGPHLPTWMNEGLAQYFEDAVLLDHGMELGLGHPRRIARVREALDTRSALPMEELIALGSRQWSQAVRTNASRSELLYAQSWSVVYFLIHGDDARYLRPFEVYLRLLSDGEAHAEAFRTAFGVGALGAIEDRWRTHALAQRPDPVAEAAARLEFLGAAIAHQHAHGEAMPRHLRALRQDLRARGFRLTRTHHGVEEVFDARDEAVFTYTRPGGERSDFLLLEPSALGLPPRLVAPGLSPEPNLVWEFRPDGTIAHEIEFR